MNKKEEYMKIYDQYACAALIALSNDDEDLIWGEGCETHFSSSGDSISRVASKIAHEMMKARNRYDSYTPQHRDFSYMTRKATEGGVFK